MVELTRIIKLSNDKEVLVDSDDYDVLSKWKWKQLNGRHIVRTASKRNGKHITVLMHRVVNRTPSGMVTDHINQNPLDNRKSNLRTVTHSENLYNHKLLKNNTSGYNGIDFYRNKWRARLSKKIIGYFKTIENAILARLLAEKERGILCLK